MFLLDTNVVSELRKGRNANPGVVKWAAEQAAGSLFISAITVLELEHGILLAERRDAPKGAILRSWLDQHVLPAFDGRILPVDAAVALRAASLHVPDLRSDRDALIAATALVHGLTVATRNDADFAPTGAKLVNPWS